MRLIDLSAEYRESARLISERIKELQAAFREDKENLPDSFQIKLRIEALQAMYRETCEVAVLLEKYYDKEYRRNARYSL